MSDIENVVERQNAILDNEEKKAWFMLGVGFNLAVTDYEKNSTTGAGTKKLTVQGYRRKYTSAGILFNEEKFRDIFLHINEIYAMSNTNDTKLESIISEAYLLYGKQEHKLSEKEAQNAFLFGMISKTC